MNSPEISGETVREIARRARNLRVKIIRMLAAASSGHPAGALGLADIYAALFFGDTARTSVQKSGGILRYDFANPDWDLRDLLVISGGHTVPVFYAVLAEIGAISDAEMLTLRKFGSRLQGHPEREKLPWLETTSGPLGEGLSQAAGMAYAIKNWRNNDTSSSSDSQLSSSSDLFRRSRLDSVRPERFARDEHKNDEVEVSRKVICITGDGELDEGENWEAALFAAKNHLANLVAIVDRNHIQIDGTTETVLPIEPLNQKWASFGWNVVEIDGNDIAQIRFAFAKIPDLGAKPTVILAHTIPGKGVDFMENDYRWHGEAPNKTEAEKAIAQLEAAKI
jgi:transketolase